MTRLTRVLLLAVAFAPLGCPLLSDDDFVLVDEPMSGPAAGGAPGPPLDEDGQAGDSDCDVENWSGRGALPQSCGGKPSK